MGCEEGARVHVGTGGATGEGARVGGAVLPGFLSVLVVQGLLELVSTLAFLALSALWRLAVPEVCGSGDLPLAAKCPPKTLCPAPPPMWPLQGPSPGHFWISPQEICLSLACQLCRSSPLAPGYTCLGTPGPFL